jgi:hypothetical protein
MILQEFNGKFTVTVPQDLVRAKGWKKGQKLLCAFDHEGNVVLRELSQ